MHIIWLHFHNYTSFLFIISSVSTEKSLKCKRLLTRQHNCFSSVCGFERPRRWGSGSVLGQLKVSSFGLSIPIAHHTFCMKVTIKNCKPYCWAYHPLAVPPERLFVVVFEVKPVGHPRVIRNHCGEDVKNCDWDPQGIANKPTIKPDPDVARRHDQSSWCHLPGIVFGIARKYIWSLG